MNEIEIRECDGQGGLFKLYRYWHYVMGEVSKEIIMNSPVKVMKQNYERFHMITSEC